MKNFLSTALVAVMLMLALQAQAQIKFGVKGGLNVTTMKFNRHVLDKSNSEGFYFGPTMKFTLPVVGLDVDASALFSQRSSKFVAEQGNEQIITDCATTLTQQAISIPVNLRYDVSLGDDASIYFFAGPQASFSIGNKNRDINWKWNDADFSVNVGFGVMLLRHLQVNTNYNLGIGKTGELKSKSIFTTLDKGFHGRASTWQLGLAYYF